MNTGSSSTLGNNRRRSLRMHQHHQQQHQQPPLLDKVEEHGHSSRESFHLSVNPCPAAVPQMAISTTTSNSQLVPAAYHTSRRIRARRRMQETQQQQSLPKRPGWPGIWWADAGGVGLAVGPSHVLHTVSTVLAVYTIDPMTGSQTASKVFALQDLFAPVRAANCRSVRPCLLCQILMPFEQAACLAAVHFNMIFLARQTQLVVPNAATTLAGKTGVKNSVTLTD